MNTIPDEELERLLETVDEAVRLARSGRIAAGFHALHAGQEYAQELEVEGEEWAAALAGRYRALADRYMELADRYMEPQEIPNYERRPGWSLGLKILVAGLGLLIASYGTCLVASPFHGINPPAWWGPVNTATLWTGSVGWVTVLVAQLVRGWEASQRKRK